MNRIRINKARVGLVALCWLSGLFILVNSLFAIQVVGWQPWKWGVRDYSNMAFQQQMRGLALDSGRPQYLDRYGQALNGEWRVDQLVQENCKELINRWVPAGEHTVGRQIIGVATRELGGVVGLEKVMQSWMKNNEPSRWSYIHLEGEHRSSACKIYYFDRSGGYLPYRVQTTLWREMQRSVERILLENRIKRGTVIVLNAHNADVLAMASAPRWGIHAETWRQGALELLPPGSVFKLVSWFTYAKQTPRSKWLLQRTNCLGHSQRVNGVRCWNEAGHGILNGVEALAHSCNIWFAAQQHLFSLAALERTGKELGLFQAVGYPGQWIAEPTGRIGTVNSNDLLDRNSIPFDRSTGQVEDDLGQRVFSAIGQADVLITPLQAANLMVTILNDGQVHRPRLIQGIDYANGVNYKRFEVMRHQAVRSIPNEAYDLLLKALREAVQIGTARSVSQEFKLAGKTGTAQFGAKKATESFHTHHWFVGYYPYDHPKYVIAVVVEDQIAQISSQALPLVERILQEIESLNAKK